MSGEGQMSMDKIDELLNSFVDGELTPREQTEVERLILHDAKIAARLGALKACKLLVGSVPVARAPAGMAERIMTRIRMGTETAEGQEIVEIRKGGRHLMARRLLAAAAMIALVAVLAGVIYTIVASQPGADRSTVSETWQKSTGKAVKLQQIAGSAGSTMKVEPFEGQLVLVTRDLVAVDAFINKAIETNGLQYSVTKDPIGGNMYSVQCAVSGLNTLLGEIETVWTRLDTATLLVFDGKAEYVTIEDVGAGQVGRIVNERSIKERIRLAKDFSVLNNIDRMLPGKEILAITTERNIGLINIPKPVLTSGEKSAKAGVVQQPGGGVRLTIVVTAAD